MNTNKLDVLAIGDIVVDAFIKLEDATETFGENHQHPMLCVRFGDKVPYQSLDICNAVGNAPNAAVSCARLGLNTALLTYLGNDQYGKDCLDQLKKENIHTDYIHIEDGKKTNYHFALWYATDRTILIKHEKFTYGMAGIPTGENAPRWIYLSSLGENSLGMYTEIEQYLKDNPDTKLAFQPGIFDMKLGIDKLKHIYTRSEIVSCNVEEAQRILGEESRDLKVLLSKLHEALGVQKILISDGFAGAYAYDGEQYYFVPIYPHDPYESTGAGDAFFSTIVAALSHGKSLTEALTWGPVNAMSVVQQIGAQRGLLTQDQLFEYLKNAPADYKIKTI